MTNYNVKCPATSWFVMDRPEALCGGTGHESFRWHALCMHKQGRPLRWKGRNHNEHDDHLSQV